MKFKVGDKFKLSESYCNRHIASSYYPENTLTIISVKIQHHSYDNSDYYVYITDYKGEYPEVFNIFSKEQEKYMTLVSSTRKLKFSDIIKG